MEGIPDKEENKKSNDNSLENKNKLFNKSEESKDKSPTPEEMESLEQYLKDHPDPALPESERRDPSPEIAKLESLIDEFEQKHSLEDLHAITEISSNLNRIFSHDRDMDPEGLGYALYNLSDEDREKYTKRSEAKKDLVSISALIDSLRNETSIPESEYDKAMEKYKILSRAVGMLNKNGIRHNN